MKTFSQHLDSVKTKPHRVRKVIAYWTAGGVAAFIGLLWLGFSLASGAYTLKNNNFAEATGLSPANAGVATTSQSDQLAGAAAAVGPGSSAAHIEIVNAPSASASSSASAEQTVIPF